MRKAHVKVLPLGAIVFVLVLLGGVFPSMAQAIGLTITFAGSGTGRVEANSPGTDTLNIFSSNTLDYDQNSSVTLTADPTGIGASQSVFNSWSGCASTSGNQCTVVMNAARSVTVTFNLAAAPPPPVNLTVNFAGTGTGQVAGSGAGTAAFTIFNSQTIPYDLVQPPSSVTLTATPTGLGASLSIFAGWSGAGCTGTGTCTVSMSAARTVTATFTTVQRTLTVTKAGTGSGTVTSNPGGISCGNDCTEGYANGTAVTLTAVASGGSTFASWSGGGCSGTGTCIVTMTAARAVTATFTTVQRTLTVTKAGTGSGTVTSNPGGISCGNDCTEGYANGTAVTLTAVASGGST
uniref:InlB B-repeat-containing protein n=1 Tax=unclassified Nitrospira TaxID=2652172 RepID=UPI003F9A9850